MPSKKKKYNARFPPARIKKIMQSDEEVGKVAAPVPVIISRALELFAETLLKKANGVTATRGARTLTPSHLKFCIKSEARFDFLREMVESVPELQGDVDCEAPSQVTAVAAPSPNDHQPRGRGGSAGTRGVSQPRGRGRSHPQPRGVGTGRSPGTGRPRGRPRKVPDVAAAQGGATSQTKQKRQKSIVEARFVDDPGSNSDSQMEEEDEEEEDEGEESYPASPLGGYTTPAGYKVRIGGGYSAHSPPLGEGYPATNPAYSNGAQIPPVSEAINLTYAPHHDDPHPSIDRPHPLTLGTLPPGTRPLTPGSHRLAPGPHPPAAHQNIPFNRSHSLPQVEQNHQTSYPEHPTTLSRTSSLHNSSPYPTLPSSPTAGASYHPLPTPSPTPPYHPYTSPYSHTRNLKQGSSSSSNTHFVTHKTGINGMFAMDGYYGPNKTTSEKQKLIQSQLPQQQAKQDIDEDYDCY